MEEYPWMATLQVSEFFFFLSLFFPPHQNWLWAMYWLAALVYPGQALTSIFAKDITNGQWIDAYVVESGSAPNVPSYAGSFQEDPAKTSENHAYAGVSIYPLPCGALKHSVADDIQVIIGLDFIGVANGPPATWTVGTISYRKLMMHPNHVAPIEVWLRSGDSWRMSWQHSEWSTH